MRISKTLAKIHNGELVRTCGLGHYLPFYVRYASHHGYDVLWLDLEHRAMDAREVQAILAMCHQYDIDCMVRSPTQERTGLYRYLEDGASGFMIPFVSDAAIARHVVEATKYPPLGNRGLDGAGRDADFGISMWQEGSTYIEDANSQTFLVAQIETAEAVGNLDAIAAVEGIDVLFIGPGDLGLRIGAENLDDVTASVAEVCRRHDKAWGIAGGTLEQLVQYRKMGAQMLIGAGDYALMNVLEEGRRTLDDVERAVGDLG